MRGLIDKKRGAAHFEMIVSFVFFVGFVFFLFMILKPQDTTTLSGAVVAGLYDSFEEKVHTNLSRVLLRSNYEVGVSCFVIDLPGDIFTYAIVDRGSSVKRVGGDKVLSTLNVDESKKELNVNGDGEFFWVSISPEFKEKLELSDCENVTDFFLGSVVERRVISYSALKEMEERYHSGGYEDLRAELRIPLIFDFAIDVKNLNIKMEPPFGIPDSVEVMAEDRVVEVLRSNGTVSNERFTFKIW